MFWTRKFGAKPSPAGIGVMELLVTIVCCSILIVAGVPSFHRLSQEFSLKGGVQLLEASLLWGRMHAISANTPLMLVVDPAGHVFYWADPVSGARYEGSARTLPAHVRIAAAPRRPLRFFQHGNAAPAGTYVVQGETGAFRVVINTMGRIRIQRV
jgi:Tfp pilus assembly protein FimT